jgi:hypothetical protein
MFIPVPQEGRRAPVQQYYPADNGIEPDPYQNNAD